MIDATLDSGWDTKQKPLPNLYMAVGCKAKISPKDRKEEKISVPKDNEPNTIGDALK